MNENELPGKENGFWEKIHHHTYLVISMVQKMISIFKIYLLNIFWVSIGVFDATKGGGGYKSNHNKKPP